MIFISHWNEKIIKTLEKEESNEMEVAEKAP